MSSTPHDDLAKAALSRPENAIGALKAALPAALLGQLDLASLKLAPRDRYLDAAGKAMFSDLVYEVQLADRPALICFCLYEHQSTQAKFHIVRVLGYVAGLWRAWIAEHPDATRIPPVIPVVLYHGAKPWSAPTSLAEVLDAPAELLAAAGDLLPALRFALDDLAAVDEADLRAREVAIFGRMTFLLLKFARAVGAGQADPSSFAELVKKIQDLLLLLPEDDVHRTFRYIIDVVEGADLVVLLDALKDAPPEQRKSAVTIAEQMREKGRREGLQDVLLRQLRVKFGPLSPEVEGRVRAASEATLQTWADGILTAARLEELIGEPS